MPKDKIEKGIDIIPTAISFTGKPKTGKRLLFYKSNDGGNHMELSKEERATVSQALEILAPLKEKFSDELISELEKSAAEKASEKVVEKIVKSKDVPDEVKETLNSLLESQKELKKSNDELMQKIEKSAEEKEAERKETLKKSLETEAGTLGALPVETNELSQLMFEIYEKNGEDFYGKFVDVLKKSNEAIKEGLNDDPAGSDSEDSEISSGSAEAFTKAVLSAVEDDKSSAPRALKIINAQKAVRKQDEDSYEAYNKALKNKSIERIK